MKIVRKYFNKIKNFQKRNSINDGPDLEPYWDEKFAYLLETWGTGNVWDEIQYFFVGRNGKVLDIACGTGKTIEILSKYKSLEIFGCDISDFLIEKAISRGINEENLSVCDATHMDYENDFYDYSYSIGSLEHFTSEGISLCIAESFRITKQISFHTVPVSKSGKDDGWIKKTQSYYNNSTDWWLRKFQLSYKTVIVLDSRWQDEISNGKWFVCIK